MTKQVALADATYKRLRALKRGGESFSQTIERLADAQAKDPLSILRDLPNHPVVAATRLRRLEEDRDSSWMEF